MYAAKTNPLADIGVDFDAINRKEKRMEKPSTAPVTSTVTMGKAMGSGSGIGRAGAGALRPSSNPMVGSGMGMGMGMGAGAPGASAGMGVYGVNQPMGMGMGMGMNRPMNMGMGMNLGQGVHMQQLTGFPPGSTMPGGYNPMMGNGNYANNHSVVDTNELKPVNSESTECFLVNSLLSSPSVVESILLGFTCSFCG